METINFVNYRCRRCGKIISVEKNYKHGIPVMEFEKFIVYDPHGCITEEGEKPIFEMISISRSPLKEAAQTIYQKKEVPYGLML